MPNKCSIIVIVNIHKKKPILSKGVGAPTQIDFFNIHIHKFIVQKGLEFETQHWKCCDITVECYALLLLHIISK